MKEFKLGKWYDFSRDKRFHLFNTILSSRVHFDGYE